MSRNITEEHFYSPPVSPVSAEEKQSRQDLMKIVVNTQ